MTKKKLLSSLLFLLLMFAPAALALGPERHWFESKRLQAEQFFLDYNCMVEALWYEARNDNEKGKRAVATVILNRVQSKRFPDSICGVIQQRMQFSYRNKLKNKRAILTPKPKQVELHKLEIIKQISYEVASGTFKPVLPSNVMWYHVHSVNPVWNRKMQAVVIPGSKHKFLKGNDRG